jgi:hypothetical protein
MATITAPVEGFHGEIGSVQFANGQAVTDDPAVIAYCQGAGYVVDFGDVDQVDAGEAGNPPADPPAEPTNKAAKSR